MNNQSEIPANLRIFVTGSGVNMSGDSAFHGVIIAPYGKFSASGGSQIYGAVMASDVKTSGNASFHYDEALATTDLNLAGSTQPFLGG